MPNISFKPADNCDVNSELECYVNVDNNIYIQIKHISKYGNDYGFICLDTQTAILFRKHLAQQIAIAKEVKNG